MEIEEYLKSNGIKFKEFSHEPVFTVEEARTSKVYESIRGIHVKNLFIKDRKSKIFWLIIVNAEKKVDMKELGEKLENKIKFANEGNLKEILGLTPGSVSPFGLINDVESKVIVVIDKEVWKSDFVSFHPNVNTKTWELSQENFHKYIQTLKNKLEVIEIWQY